MACFYAAKVRVSVRAGSTTIVRDGTGTGHSEASSPGTAHDMAIKAAETDGTKRALATFGNPFGLALYDRDRAGVTRARPKIRNALSRSGDARASRADKQAPPDGRPGRTLLKQHRSSGKDGDIDKSRLPIGEPKRTRCKEHLKFVAQQPCVVCGRQPSQPHHVQFAQPRALGRKVGDEFTIPLCATHHRQLHDAGDERDWWRGKSIDPLKVADGIWRERLNRLQVKDFSTLQSKI